MRVTVRKERERERGRGRQQRLLGLLLDRQPIDIGRVSVFFMDVHSGGSVGAAQLTRRPLRRQRAYFTAQLLLGLIVPERGMAYAQTRHTLS